MRSRAIVPIALALVMCSAPATVSPEPTPSPTPAVSPAPTVSEVPLQGPPLRNTVAVATSAVVPTAPPPATPTPTPDPAVWRLEGRVTDDQGNGLADVCVVIGPLGCKPFSPHTDGRGVWYIDLPQNASVTYELRFELSGYTGVYYRATPGGPTVFNVVLTR